MQLTEATIITSFRSRRAAVAEFVTMLILGFGVAEETATQVSAIIMAGAAVIAYIVGEGLADAAGASNQVYIPDLWDDEKPPANDESCG